MHELLFASFCFSACTHGLMSRMACRKTAQATLKRALLLAHLACEYLRLVPQPLWVQLAQDLWVGGKSRSPWGIVQTGWGRAG